MDNNETQNQYTNTNQLDNKTYIDCHDEHEENTDERAKVFIDLWNTTNLWLSIIGIYFFGKILLAIAKIGIALYLGKNLFEALF